MDPSLDPSLYALDPSLAGDAPALDPSLAALDPSLAAPQGVDAAAFAVAMAGLPDQPVAVAEGAEETEEVKLSKLRTNYKAAAISHWATLFLHHAGDEFDVEAFENDLIDNADDDKFLPKFLGRVLNTLANDRNTNDTNWLAALRRSYNRRVASRTDNPFYTWVKVPASVVEAELALEREKDDKEWEDKFGAQQGGENGDLPHGLLGDQDQKLREAEKGLSRGTGKAKSVKPGARVKQEGEVVHEAGAADVDMSTSRPEAAVPVTEEALDDGFNAEMADVVAGNAADAVKREVKDEGENGEDEDEDDEWYEEQRAVEWKDLSMETKLDAIYNVCEWHMVDPERQFRRYLQWDGESAWKTQRLDPMGLDSEGNKYYQLADDRLWVQRPAPPPNPAQPSNQQVGIQKPKTLLGLKAGPRDKSKKGTVTGTVRVKLKKDKATGQYLQVDEEEHVSSEGEEETKPEVQEEEVEMPLWEQEYWEERLRAETTPGFVEWQCVCANLDDWRSFPARFAHSLDDNEIALRDKITYDLTPAIEEEQARREEERQAELDDIARKVAEREERDSVKAEQEARLLANAERFSRATRGATRVNYAENQFGVAASMRGASSAGGAGELDRADSGTPQTESREERLRKREEAQRAVEEREALRLAEEAREQERQDAMAANGGVLPVHLMTEDEREEYEAQQAQELKHREAEEKKRDQEEKKKLRAKERRLELKAEREQQQREEEEAEAASAAAAAARAAHAAAAAAQAQAQAQAHAQAQAAIPLPIPVGGVVDDPWWMDCELCALCGWNVDDGQELICCDDCEEWQHLPCHIQADMAAGRPPQPFHDEDYQWSCGRCQGTVPRTGRPALPNPPNAPVQVQSAVFNQLKRKASMKGQPAAKKPKTSKQPKSNGGPQPGIPYGHSGHPLYHPSAYTHPSASNPYGTSGVPAQAPIEPEPQPAPAAASEPMSYEQLKAMVEQNPALVEQLPPDYKAHFTALLGL
ncbi:hypothetical protein JCM11641_008203 [Rhodosporidiobolus odoratus]